MSNSYYLICMECKSAIHLGKTVRTCYKAVGKKTYGFSSLGYTNENEWEGTESSLAELQHFLMLHRTHELRVLPDTVDIYATDLGVPHSFPCDDYEDDPEYNRLNFFEKDVGIPDPEEEMKSLPCDVVEKLRKF